MRLILQSHFSPSVFHPNPTQSIGYILEETRVRIMKVICGMCVYAYECVYAYVFYMTCYVHIYVYIYFKHIWDNLNQVLMSAFSLNV